MNVAMAGLDPMICLVYLDDIIIHSRNLSAHLLRLRLLFDRLLVTGLKLKVSKCRLLRIEVGFLGHRISTKGLTPDSMQLRRGINTSGRSQPPIGESGWSNVPFAVTS